MVGFLEFSPIGSCTSRRTWSLPGGGPCSASYLRCLSSAPPTSIQSESQPPCRGGTSSSSTPSSPPQPSRTFRTAPLSTPQGRRHPYSEINGNTSFFRDVVLSQKFLSYSTLTALPLLIEYEVLLEEVGADFFGAAELAAFLPKLKSIDICAGRVAAIVSKQSRMHTKKDG